MTVVSKPDPPKPPRDPWPPARPYPVPPPPTVPKPQKASTWQQHLRRNLLTALLATLALAAAYTGTRVGITGYRHLEQAMAIQVGGTGTPGTYQCNATRCWTPHK